MEFRTATEADVETCLEVQRRSAVVGYAAIFPQDEYPFPIEMVRAEWVQRLGAGVLVTLATIDGEAMGIVSVRPPRLETLFVVPERWGTGTARALHDRALEQIATSGTTYTQLDVMTDNTRARRFYEKLGWAADGRVEVSPFPPYPELLGYRRRLDRP